MRNRHQLFVLCTASQIIGGDFANFCGLFRIYVWTLTVGQNNFCNKILIIYFFAGTKYFFDVGILLSEMGVCKLSRVDMLPAALRQNSVKLQWLNPILPSDSEYRNLRMVACDTTICDFEVSTILHFYILQGQPLGIVIK